MEVLFKEVAARIALGVELAAALLIAYGALEALVGLLIQGDRRNLQNRFTSDVRYFFGLAFGFFWDSSLSWRPTLCAVLLVQHGPTLDNSERLRQFVPC